MPQLGHLGHVLRLRHLRNVASGLDQMGHPALGLGHTGHRGNVCPAHARRMPGGLPL